MNWTDYLLIALVACSCIAGFMRGLLREVISLVTWVVAVWLAWVYGPSLEPLLGGALSNAAVRPWAARGVIFLAVLLTGTFAGVAITHFTRLSIFNVADRFLGAIFGLLRGLAMVGVFVILCHAARLEAESWWHESRLIPYAEQVANVLRGLVGERKIHLGHSFTASRRRGEDVYPACAASSALSVPAPSTSGCMML